MSQAQHVRSSGLEPSWPTEELLGHREDLQKLKCATPAVEVAREFKLTPRISKNLKKKNAREFFAQAIAVKTEFGTTKKNSNFVSPVKFSENLLIP